MMWQCLMFFARRRLVLPLFKANVLRVYSTATEGPNHAILEMLKTNKEEEAQNPDKNPYKIRAFTSAIRIISELDHPLQSAAEAKALKGVGPGIFQRIQDFFESGHAPGVVDAKATEQLKRMRVARAELEQITGIGPVKARELVAAGCMSLEQLRTPQYMAMLSNTQRIGVTYLRHLEDRVSRLEAEAVTQFIRDVLPSKYEIIIGGSYRRGASTSSDNQLIILHPDHVHVPFPAGTPSKLSIVPSKKPKTSLPSSLLQLEVVPALQSRGILAAALSSGDLKWQGIVMVPESDWSTRNDQWGERQRRIAAIENGEGVYRRMDLNLVAQKSRGAALLALTGDLEFNRDLRIRASRVGMHLNEFGLWRWNEGSDVDEEGNSTGFWELVWGETEEEVLKELGMEYVEPVKRNFSLVLGRTVSPAGNRKRTP
ncbi:hypothetical protein C8R43DRAFT_953973 [Mycena crocata]|nr:hypothetical protein C8R43DRAFT_953973 [Mycena crocata]